MQFRRSRIDQFLTERPNGLIRMTSRLEDELSKIDFPRSKDSPLADSTVNSIQPRVPAIPYTIDDSRPDSHSRSSLQENCAAHGSSWGKPNKLQLLDAVIPG